jgi:hypothetical protein
VRLQICKEKCPNDYGSNKPKKQLAPISQSAKLGTGTRGARAQGVSPIKRLNMTKPQPGRSGCFAQLQSKTGLGTYSRGARTQAVLEFIFNFLQFFLDFIVVYP